MEREFYRYLLIAWLGVGACAFIALQFVAAPYGRHIRPGWGPTIHRTAGWVIMESPAVFVFLACFLLSDRQTDPVGLAFLLLWLLHYVNRALIYPFRLREGQLRMPVSVMGMGFLFNLVNGYLQGRGLFTLDAVRGVAWFWDPRFVAGVLLFLGGYALNQRADAILRGLRAPGETGYRIPDGGAFQFVSCPNYSGELVEWLGWAMLTWSPAGWAFFLWTAANLLPRARAHHRWYRQHFPDYPIERKAVIPFLY
jgi:protein-S-isoprenylcysteine O-methyltransferase Ste14